MVHLKNGWKTSKLGLSPTQGETPILKVNQPLNFGIRYQSDGWIIYLGQISNLTNYFSDGLKPAIRR